MVRDKFLNYHNYVLFSLCLPSSVSIFFNFFCPTLSIQTFLPESLCVSNIQGNEQHQIQDGGQQEADEGAWRNPQMWNEKLP